MRTLTLAASLFFFWLVLSGHYTAFLVGAGLVSSGICALIAARARFVDADGHPIHMLARTPAYYPWLVVEIIKSAWHVTRIVLTPSLPITPSMTVANASQRTSPGIATYGNSITLTPGTLTVGVQGQQLLVHALTREGAEALDSGDMDRRVSKFEGSP